MALLYKMRALAVSDNDYVFWTDSEPDLDGTNAPEAVVTASIVVDSVGGEALPDKRAPLTDDLEIWMYLNEPSGTSFTNYGQAGGSDWTLDDGGGGSGATVGADGIVDKSVAFPNDEDSVITAPADANLTGWDYATMMAWVYPTDTNNPGQILWKAQGAYPDATLSFGANDGNELVYRVNNNTYTVPAGTDIIQNIWTHVAISYDGTNARVYLNGMLIQTQSAPHGTITWTNPTANVWGIGAPADRQSDRAFHGRIEDVRVYSSVKSETFIRDVVGRVLLDRS